LLSYVFFNMAGLKSGPGGRIERPWWVKRLPYAIVLVFLLSLGAAAWTLINL
jgi:hypothetical protein